MSGKLRRYSRANIILQRLDETRQTGTWFSEQRIRFAYPAFEFISGLLLFVKTSRPASEQQTREPTASMRCNIARSSSKRSTPAIGGLLSRSNAMDL